MSREAGSGSTRTVSRRGLFSLGAAKLVPSDEDVRALGAAWQSFNDAEAGTERTDFRALAERARADWSTGDYNETARALEPVAAELADRGDIEPGQSVLDVGAGDGNLALAAAARGAHVTAADLSPRMVDAGRKRCHEAGAAAEWHVADVEQLPFEDDRFDCVLSSFGAMFAPRPDRAVAEMLRVARPGGLLAMATWASTGFMGTMLDIAGRLDPLPAEVSRPSRWGRFESAFLWMGNVVSDFEMVPGQVALEFADEEDAWRALCSAPGPLSGALRRAGDEGALQDSRRRFSELVAGFREPGEEPGRCRVTADYCLLTGRKPALTAV